MKILQYITSHRSWYSFVFLSIVLFFSLYSCTVFGFKAGRLEVKNNYTQTTALQFTLSRTDNKTFSGGSNTVTFELSEGTSKSFTIDWWSLDPQSISSVIVIVKATDGSMIQITEEDNTTSQIKSAEAREIINDGKNYTFTMEDAIYDGSFIYDISK